MMPRLAARPRRRTTQARAKQGPKPRPRPRPSRKPTRFLPRQLLNQRRWSIIRRAPWKQPESSISADLASHTLSVGKAVRVSHSQSMVGRLTLLRLHKNGWRSSKRLTHASDCSRLQGIGDIVLHGARSQQRQTSVIITLQLDLSWTIQYESRNAMACHCICHDVLWQSMKHLYRLWVPTQSQLGLTSCLIIRCYV